jgi:hypothetical protein
VSFRTRKDGQVFPTGSGISSTTILGTPVSRSIGKGQTERSALQPLDFRGQKATEAGRGPFSKSFVYDKTINAAKNARDYWKNQATELGGTSKAKDFATATVEADNAKVIQLKRDRGIISELKQLNESIKSGRSKKDKEKNQAFKDDISETLEIAENEERLTENMNWASTAQALRYAAQVQGDVEAQKILELIAKKDFKKAKKLAQERQKRSAKVIAENSRISSAEGQEILTLAGLSPNAQGQYVPTTETPEIASENLGVGLTDEELAILSQNPIQPPPKLDAGEVLILAQTTKGEAKLRRWGYIK